MIEVPANLSLQDAIKYLRERKPTIEFPKPPKLPHVRVTIQDSAEEVETYAQSLLNYAKLKRKFLLDYETANTAHKAARPQCAAIDKQIIGLIEDAVGLIRLELPENKVKKLWAKAWENANSEDEAIENLRELVELLED